MATVEHTRRASGSRGRVNANFPADVHSAQPATISALLNMIRCESGVVRRSLNISVKDAASQAADANTVVPILFSHDGVEYRVASPQQVLEQARLVIAQRFERGVSLMSQPQVVDELLAIKLASEAQAVFAALFLDRHYRVLDFDVLFRGTMDSVTIYPREVLREAIQREAEVVIAARNDPAGDCEPTPRDIADARRLRNALGLMEIALADYLVVGKSVTSLAERNWCEEQVGLRALTGVDGAGERSCFRGKAQDGQRGC